MLLLLILMPILDTIDTSCYTFDIAAINYNPTSLFLFDLHMQITLR